MLVGGYYNAEYPPDRLIKERPERRQSYAWSPPIAAYEKLLEMGFYIRALYYEGGMAFAGVWDNGIDDYYEYGGMDSKEIADTLPIDLDEAFGISESVAEWEAENAEDEENIDIDLDGGLSATNE